MADKTWPTLYKLTSTGKIQQWTIMVDGATISTQYGQQGGAITQADDTIKAGKNIGRANETTPEEQARNEAQSQFEKKLKKDYVRTVEEAKSGKSSELVAGGILPMLAHKYRDHAKKIKWPAACQPKLDGHRCIAIVVDGKCTLWARSRAQIHSVPHIIEAVEALGFKDIILDGELYNHAYKDNFEDITHLLKRDEPCLGGGKCDRQKKKHIECRGYKMVQYHIYDAAIPGTFADRHKQFYMQIANWAMQRMPDSFPTPLVPVKTVTVADDAELQATTDDFLEQGYEGSMVRNLDGPYHNKKCYDLLKVKIYEDDEFPVVRVEEGRGKLSGHAIFVCKVPDDYEDERGQQGAEFNAKMKGKIGDLKQYWEDPSLAVGRDMTVQFQGFTKTNKVPRFPVALRFREDL